MNKLSEIVKNHSLAFAFLLYELVITIRIFVEMEDLTLYVFVHQLFWFNSVLAIFFMSFKKILRIDADKLWILAGGSFLTFIPIVYCALSGKRWSLNYIEPASFSQIMRDVFTMLAGHSYNWPMFPELLALFILSAITGTLLTGKYFKPVAVSLVTLYGAFFILGFSWISVNPEHPSLFHLTTSLPEQQFYAFQLISLFSIISVFSYSRELLELTHEIRHRLYFTLSLIVSVLSFQGLFMFLFIKKIYFADIIVSFVPLSIIILTAGALLKSEWREKAVIPAIVSILTIAVMV